MGTVLTEPVSSKLAWKASDYEDRDDWIDCLSRDEICELECAARALPDNDGEWINHSLDDITAPNLLARLDSVVQELEFGRGFSLVGGIDVDEYDVPMLRRIYWILGICLGQSIPQNAAGELMTSITDLGQSYTNDVDARGYLSSDGLRFHSDGGDVVALFCIRQAPNGGENSVVSMMTIYNEILRTRPEYLEIFYRGFPHYIRRENGNAVFGDAALGKISAIRYPIFSYYRNQLSGGLNLKTIEGAEKAGGYAFSTEERDALCFIEQTAEREDLQLSFYMQPGDIVLLHNLMVLHKRSQFRDDADPNKKRMLLRFWLNLPNGRPLEPFIDQYLRGGFQGVTPIVRSTSTFA